MVGAIGGKLGTSRYQGRYQAVQGGPIQGPLVGVVIARVGRLKGFPPPLVDLSFILAFS